MKRKEKKTLLIHEIKTFEVLVYSPNSVSPYLPIIGILSSSPLKINDWVPKLEK